MSEILSVNNVSKTYSLKKGKNRKAVNRLSLSINENEIVGLLGPNGAGKTTLIKMICGLIIPDDGNITLNGKSNIDRNDYYTSFGALLEGSRNIYWKMTIEENMDYFYILKKGHNSNRKQYKEYLLDLMGLSEHRTKTVGQLSRGLQQRASIVVNLFYSPSLFLMDEPTLGIDVEGNITMRKKIVELSRNNTFLITSHDMNFIESVCSRIVLISDGQKIKDCSIEDFKCNKENLEQSFLNLIEEGKRA